MLKVVPSELQFGVVAVNDVPVYCRFSVVNTDPTVSLFVQLTTTTAPLAIRFKLWDDMTLLEDDEIEGSDTPKGLQRGEALCHHYNAVFDDAYIIDQLVLQPLETKSVIAIFYADPVQFSNVMPQTSPTMVSGAIHLTAASLPRETLFLSGAADSLNKSEKAEEGNKFAAQSSSYSFEGINNKSLGKSYAVCRGRTKEKDDASSLTGSPVWGDKSPLSRSSLSATTCSSLCALRSETVTLPFSAGVCISLLIVSKSELQTTMAPNRTHLMDFSVRNASSLPLPFVIRTQTMPHKNIEFALYEEDKFEDPMIGRPLLLDGHASMNFTLVVRTTATAVDNSTTDMRYYRAVLQCDNLRDARNSELVYVRVNIVASGLQRDLVSLENPVLDFGEVYRGTQVLRKLNFCTTSRGDMTVRLLDSRPQHCEGALSLARVSNTSSSDDDDGTATGGDAGMLLVDELGITSPKSTIVMDIVYVPSTDQGRKGTANLKFELELVITGCGGDSGDSRRQQHIIVRCLATLFTSTIVASQKNINFGDCQVGQSRRCTFEVKNPSPLPTTIRVELRSKIVSIEGVHPRTSATGGRETVGEFSIAPLSALPLSLRINPQRVNPNYHKQLTIVNVSNPAEDRLIVNIEANNMAPLEAKLHNTLYTCKCKAQCDDGNSNGSTNGGRGGHDGTGASSLRVLTNVPLIVAYVLQSKTDYPLVLRLQCSSSEIETFCLEDMSAVEFESLAAELRTYCCCGGGGEDVAQQLLPERAEEVRSSLTKALRQHAVAIKSLTLEPHGSRTFYVNICRTSGGSDVATKEDGVSIAVDGFEMPRFMRLSYRLCGTRFELGGQKTKNFGEVNIGERKTTKLLIVNQCNSLLLLRLSKSRSVAAGDIRMENSDKKSIYCLIRPYATKEVELSFYPGIKGVFEERILLTNVLDPSNEVTMTVKATITKAATFDVSPDSWNFGVVSVPMLAQPSLQTSLQATNSGSSSSGGGCRGNNATVGCEEAGRPAARVRARFTVVNTSTTRRALRLKLVPSTAGSTSGNFGHGTHSGTRVCSGSGGAGNNDNAISDGLANLTDRFFRFDGVDVQLQLEMEHRGASAGISCQLEEKIEQLEQKLKIYFRKNKVEKAEATRRQIDTFRRILTGEVVDLNTTFPQQSAGGVGDEDGDGEQEEEEQWYYREVAGSEDKKIAAKPKSRPLQHSESMSLLLRDGVALPEMNAGESTVIILDFTCARIAERIPPAQSGIITFLLYETKDKEASRVIPVDLTLICMETENDALITTNTATATSSFVSGANKQSVLPGMMSDGCTSGASLACFSKDTALLEVNTDVGSASTTLPVNNVPMPLVPPLSSVILVEPGDGVVATTFMRCPMALVVHCVAYVPYKFSIFVRAACDTSVVLLNPIRFCDNILNNSSATVNSGNSQNDDVFCGRDGHSALVNGAPLLSTSLTPDASLKSLDAHFSFSPRNGTIRGNESLCIAVECTPMSFLPQRYFIPVKNLQHAFDVKYLAVEINPRVEEDLLHVSPKEIRLSDIVMPCEKQCLDVQSFVVHSRLTLPHSLIIRSNRPSFVSFFLDSECTVPLVNPVKHTFTHGELRIYVRFAPSERSWRHKSRVVVAGIFVEAVATDWHAERVGYSVLAQTAVRLSVRVGNGELLVRESFIDLGAVPPHCSSVSTTVTFLNPSDHFEVRARLEASSALTVEMPELTLLPGAEVSVPVKLQLTVPGLVQESLFVCNLSCKQKPLTVGLLVLRHDEAISARIVNEDGRLLNNHRQYQQQHFVGGDCGGKEVRWVHHHHGSGDGDNCSGEVVVFPTAAVVFGEDAALRLHSPVTTAALHITNHSTRDFILVAKSNMPLVFGPLHSLSFGEDTLSSTLSSHLYPRGRVRLDAHHTEPVAWTLVSMPLLTTEQTEQLLQHGVVTIEAVAQVCVAQIVDEVVGFNYGAMLFLTKRALPTVGQCVLLPKFIFTFALSRGRAEPPLIDLGIVGTGKGLVTNDANDPTGNDEILGQLTSSFDQRHAATALSKSRWTDRDDGNGSTSTPVVICLTNLSPILPLRLSVECEPTVRFISNRIVVPPLQTVTVEAFLVLKLIRTQGPFSFPVYFVNELNPEDDKTVYVTGQYYWKVFELSCDGVMDGERESLSMEALCVRETSAAGDILSESKIVMTAIEPRVEVGVGVTGNSKLEGVIQLQVLQYDAAASLEKIVFGQSEHDSSDIAATTATTVIGRGGNTNNNNNNNRGGGSVHATDGVANSGASLSAAALSAGFALGSNTKSGVSSGVGGGNNGGAALTMSMASNAPTSASILALTTADSRAMNMFSRQKEQQSFRLRCVLMKEDFAALSAAFYGQRKMKQVDIIRERQAMTFDKIIDVVERRRSTESSTMWLGTLHFSNALTGSDEVQVFSTLSAFQTFCVPTRIALTPCTMSTTGPTTPTTSTTMRAAVGRGRVEASDMNYSKNNVYVGELVVSNPCLKHCVALSVTALKDRAYQNGVSVSCILLDGEATTSPQTETSRFSGASHNCSMTREEEYTATNTAVSVADASSIIPSPTTASAKSASGWDAGETTTLFVSILPQCVQRIQVVMRVDIGKHQQSVEQAVVLALFDESVPCSAVVVRIDLAPLDELAQQQLFMNSPLLRVDAAGSGTVGGGGGGVCENLLENVVDGDDTAITPKTMVITPNMAATTKTGVGLASSVNTHAASFLPQRVLSLHGNCRAVPGCCGAYAYSFSYTKDAPPTTNITICNNLRDKVVEYNVSIVSQGPQPWLLLPSATAVLGPGEKQPLRLDIRSTEAGSFNGYVSIANTTVPGEVLLLQLSAEVFVPTAGEGLFEIIASNGQRMSTNTEQRAFVGRFFGEGTRRAYVALEILNRSAIPLEFPVSVMRPFRMEFVNAPDEADIIDFTTTTTTTTNNNDNNTPTTVTATASRSHNSSAHGFSGTRREASADARGTDDGDVKHQPQQHSCVSARPECDVQLLVCELRNVQDMYDQKRFLVGPKSRVKVVFSFVCDRLSLPSGFVVHGEAEVVLKCKQARDAKFVIKARFDVCRPSIGVPRQFFFAPADDFIVSIPVRNFRSRDMRVTFRTFSPVVDVLPEDDETRGDDARDKDRHHSQPAQQEGGINFTIAGGSTNVIRVRLNVARLLTLQSWSSPGDMAAELPTLCDHGLLLDTDNPSERVRVELCYLPSSASNAVSSVSIAAIAAAHPIAKSLRLEYRQIFEQRLFQFVQNFCRVLSEAADMGLLEFRYYTEQEEMDASGTTNDTVAAVISGGNSLGGGTHNNNSNTNISNANNNNHNSSHTSTSVSCWMALRSLLVDLTCLVEELTQDSVLQSDLRTVEAHSVFLVASITSHPLMRAWRQQKANLPTTSALTIFGKYLKAIDALPCWTPSSE